MPRNKSSRTKKNHLRGAVSKQALPSDASAVRAEQIGEADIVIDGSQGEGGGQIVRVSLALSSILRLSVKVHKIRHGRSKPGLQAQHLSGAQLVAQIASAELTGGHQGSTCFLLGRSSESSTDQMLPLRSIVSTAGATSLVLQAALPAALCFLPSVPIGNSEGKSTLLLTGGTTALFAPPSDYVAKVLVPNLRHFGVEVCYEVEKHGFFPKGGGLCRVTVDKAACLQMKNPTNGREYCLLNPCDLTERGSILSIAGNVLVCGGKYCGSGLGEAMRHQATQVLRKYARSNFSNLDVTDDCISIQELTDQEGTGHCMSITLYATTSGGTVIGASTIWSDRDAAKIAKDIGVAIPPRNTRGLEGLSTYWRPTACHAAKGAAEELCAMLDTGAPVDSHMADQLCIFMAMSNGTSRLLIPEPTQHVTSVIDVCQSFNIEAQLEHVPGSRNCVITCEGMGVSLRGAT